MIRLSKPEDKEGIIALWQEAFGDTREAIELFLSKRYSPNHTLVAEESGKIASMLFLLEGKVSVGGTLLNAYYLYAAATLKEYRGRGIMALMLSEAKKLARSRGIDLICLKPAEESLYGFYEKHGYKTVFSTKTAVIEVLTTAGFKDICANDELYRNRERAFKDYDRFIWDKQAVEFAVEQHKYYGGKVFASRQGHLLYSVCDGVCYVKEICFTSSSLLLPLAQIAYIEGVSAFVVDLPVDCPVFSEAFSVKNNGMALLISENAKVLNERNNLYLNLTLD